MQEKFFPKVNDDNINEYLLNQEENKPGQNNLINNQNIINSQDVTDKYFVGPEEKQGKIDINAESLYFCIPQRVFLFFGIVVLSLILILVTNLLIIIVIIDALLLIFIIICCYKKTLRRLEVIKDENSGIIILNAFNFFNCLYKKLQLTNINFYIGSIYDNREKNHIFYRLFIMKNLEKSPEIDLVSSNVKTTPLKLYYYFDHIRIYKDIDIEKKLNGLVGNKNYECPFKFDINRYMNIKLSKEEKRIINQPLKNFYDRSSYSQYLKFCDNFYCYYLEEPFSDKTGDILRIDIIYSNNFDIIFIGLVNNNQKSYKNTFEFNMSIIEKFVLQKISYEYEGFHLKVIFKDKTNQLIYSLKKSTQENLRGLIFILNERLNIIKNMNKINEITEDNPPPIASNNI